MQSLYFRLTGQLPKSGGKMDLRSAPFTFHGKQDQKKAFRSLEEFLLLLTRYPFSQPVIRVETKEAKVLAEGIVLKGPGGDWLIGDVHNNRTVGYQTWFSTLMDSLQQNDAQSTKIKA